MNEITFTTGTATYSAETASEQPNARCQQCTAQASGNTGCRVPSAVSEADMQKSVETYRRLLCNLRKRAATNPSAKKLLRELLEYVAESDKEVEEQLKQDSCPEKPQEEEECCKNNQCDTPPSQTDTCCDQCACGLSEKYVSDIIDQVQDIYDAASKVLGHSFLMNLRGNTHADTLKLGYYLGVLNAAVNAMSIEADVCEG